MSVKDFSKIELSSFQAGIWIECQQEAAATPQYTIALCYQLPAGIENDYWKNAAESVLNQEAAWRIRLLENRGTPFFSLSDGYRSISTIELPDTDELDAHTNIWHQKTWHLIDNPLLDVQLVKCEASNHLLFRAHHIVMDGWGLGILLKKIIAVAHGKPLSEKDIMSPQANGDSHQDTSPKSLAKLAESLKDVDPALFPQRQDTAGSELRFQFVLPEKQVQALIHQGISPLHNTAASLAVLLSSLHHQHHAIIGLTLLNRPAEKMEEVSQRANILPLLIPIEPSCLLRDFARQLKPRIRQLKECEQVTLSEVTSLLANGDARRRWFDTTLSYVRFPEADFSPSHAPRYFAHVHDSDAIAVYMHSYGSSSDVNIDICVNEHAFDRHFTAADFADKLCWMISNFHLWLDHSIQDLPLATANDLALECGPSLPYGAQTTITSLFAQQALSHPTRLAAQDASGRTLSYQELDGWSSDIAHSLNALGAGPASVVAIALPRSVTMLAAIFGILKAGAVYLPIDCEYPSERIQCMLEDSQALLLIAEREDLLAQASSCTWINAKHIERDSLPRKPPLDRSAPDQLAYLIYTSGSTGQPKGVAIEHHAMVNRLEWMQHRYPLGQEDVILQKTPISFDVSIWELFWWAISGASVAMLEPGAQRDPRELIRAIAKYGVSVLHFVPSMFEPYLQMLEQDQAFFDATASVRRVFTSGEALSPASVNQFKALYRRRSANIGLTNLYGPTEATVDVSCYDIDCAATEAQQEVPIGHPIQNTQLRLVSSTGITLPPGMPGELLIGGVQLARGYWNRPDLTAEKFPLDTRTGTRWYRTGDLAMRQRDGSIRYLGRMDGQVKIRGNRIELGEIKAALATLQGIDKAEVLVDEHAVRGKQLVAVYISRYEQDAESLRRQLLKRLPAFMIPARFHFLERIPLTPNGKFDRAEMARILSQTHTANETGGLNKQERLIAGIWEKVLSRAPQHPDDDFYALGGDSLLMLKVRSALEDAGLKASLLALARHTRLKELAAFLAHGGSAQTDRQESLAPFALLQDDDAAKLGAYQDAYPASQLQLGLIYHSKETADSRKYKDVFRYSLNLSWHPDRFKAALKEAVERHPALRTRFNLADFGQALQLILPEQDLAEILTIHSASAIGHEHEISDSMRALASHPYNFQHGPLYGFMVFTREGGIDLIFHFHHALLDGGSVANLIRELLMRYAALEPITAEQLPPSLPSPSIYIRNEQNAIRDEDTKRYWRHYLAGAPSSSAPTGLAKHLGESRGGLINHTVRLEPGLHARIHSAAAAARLPAKSLFLAAHCLTLSILSGNDEIITGIVTHVRPEVRHAEHLLGLFLNTLPMRFCRQGLNWLDAAREAFQTEKRHHPHRHLPQSEIQAAAGQAVAVNTAFNYVHFHMLQDAIHDGAVQLERFDPREETNFDILVNVMRDFDGEGSVIRIDMNGSAFAEFQAERYAQIMLQSLRRIVDHPREPATLARTLAECGISRRSSPAAGFVPVTESIREVVRQKPDAIAIVHGETAWSYRQLWERSSQIAALLRTNDCAPGHVVGIALERSPELVATLLAILRVGAVCLPLDPAYPADRIDAILAQAGPKAIIAAASFPAGRFDAPILLQGDGILGAGMATADADGHAAPGPDDLAYILFTSGSTGQPKGVAMPHRGLANLIEWQNSTQSGASHCSTLQFAPLSFDVSFQEIFATLAAGGMLHMIDESMRKDPVAVLKLLDHHWIERIYLPYIALQQLAETAIQLNLIPEQLKVIVSSGEQLRVTDEIRAFIGALKGGILENQYGPTETHVVTFHTLAGQPSSFPALPPIGKPIHNSGLLLLDRDLRKVPDGAPGEICVYGNALAAGYYRAPELTAQKFVHHDDVPGARLYRTGDIGIRLQDGSLISLGRNDSQVKVRGYRIELAEVETAALRFFESIVQNVEVAVVARTREGHDAYLIAYLRGQRDDALAQRLREHLTGKLPHYMLPSHIEWISDIPTTPSGKRDDAKLRQMALTSRHREERRLPQDSLELKLCQMAAALLEQPAISPEQNLFECGATSLTAMRLVVLVDKHYGVDIPLSSFISAPTIAQLASLVRDGDGGSRFDPLVPMRTSGDRRPLFMVHPMGGNVLAYMRMLKHLPPAQPLYALQASGVDAGSAPLSSVAEQASRYIETIRRVQPHGPYILGGWSYGGFIAFEMARQLQAAGETVSDLFILDTVALSYQSPKETSEDALLGWFFWELLWLANGSALPAQIVPASITELQQRFEYIADHAIRTGALPEGSSRAVIQRLFDVYRANWRAASEYDVGRPAIDITLLRARQPLPQVLREMHDAIRSEYQDPQNGWGSKSTGRIKTIAVDGDHLTIMEEPAIGNIVAVMLEQMDATNKEIEYVG